MSPPTLLGGRYEVLLKLKEGGMGAIYKARDLRTGVECVVKVMRPALREDPSARLRFAHEARMAERIAHEHVARVLDFVEEADGSAFIAMEFVDGATLAEYVARRGPLPLSVALDVGIQTLEALSALHALGIVHRDIAPDNIMVRETGGRLFVKLIDLGIAKEADSDFKTSTGIFVGKLRYCSPEQLGALKPGQRIDGRSDVYSLGCVLYLLLTGTPAISADTPQAYIAAHTRLGARTFDERDPDGLVPAAARAALRRAVASDREERWPSAAAFADALRAIRDGLPGPGRIELPPAEARTVVLPPREPSGPGRTRTFRVVAAAAALAGAAVLLLVVGRPWAGKGPALAPVAGTPAAPPTPTAAPAAEGSLVVTASPWGRIVSVVVGATGREVVVAGGATPARLSLPPGSYRIQLRGPGASGEGTVTVTASVAAGSEARVHATLPGFVLDEAVGAFVPGGR